MKPEAGNERESQTDSSIPSVVELLSAFRGALIALVPIMDQVGIKWRDEDAYDDWDDIAATLYTHRQNVD